MTALKLIGALAGMAACLIPFLALTDEYERAMGTDPREARVLEVRGDVVRYEAYDPDSRRDLDGDGWIGPYRTEDVPDEARASLHPGDALVTRRGKLELSLARPTPLFLVGVVLFFLMGVWTIAGPILERRELAAAKSDPIKLIVAMVRKSRNAKLVAAGFILLMGGALTAVPIFVEGKLWERGMIGGLGSLAVALAAYTFLAAWRIRSPKRAPVVRAIIEDPERIVWIYEHILRINGIPTHTVFVLQDDGRKYDFALGQVHPDDLTHALASLLPNAIIGYSTERKQAYEASPGTFRAVTA